MGNLPPFSLTRNHTWKRIIHIFEQICKSENTWNRIWLGLILTSCRGSWQRKGRRWRGRRKSQGRNQGPSAATSQIDEDIDDWEGVLTRTHKSQRRGAEMGSRRRWRWRAVVEERMFGKRGWIKRQAAVHDLASPAVLDCWLPGRPESNALWASYEMGHS